MNDFQRTPQEHSRDISAPQCFPSRMACCAGSWMRFFPGFLMSGKQNAQFTHCPNIGPIGKLARIGLRVVGLVLFGARKRKDERTRQRPPAVHTKLRVGIERPSTKGHVSPFRHHPDPSIKYRISTPRAREHPSPRIVPRS